MVVWPGIVMYAVVHFAVRVAGAFGSKFPDRPFGAMFVVEKFNEGVCRVAVGTLWVGRRRPGCRDD